MNPPARGDHHLRFGDVVLWLRNGQPEFGVLEGVQGESVWVRRIDGPSHTHARRLPKPVDELVVICTADDFAAWLTDRARLALAQFRTVPARCSAPGSPAPRPGASEPDGPAGPHTAT